MDSKCLRTSPWGLTAAPCSLPSSERSNLDMEEGLLYLEHLCTDIGVWDDPGIDDFRRLTNQSFGAGRWQLWQLWHGKRGATNLVVRECMLDDWMLDGGTWLSWLSYYIQFNLGTADVIRWVRSRAPVSTPLSRLQRIIPCQVRENEPWNQGCDCPFGFSAMFELWGTGMTVTRMVYWRLACSENM